LEEISLYSLTHSYIDLQTGNSQQELIEIWIVRSTRWLQLSYCKLRIQMYQHCSIICKWSLYHYLFPHCDVVVFLLYSFSFCLFNALFVNRLWEYKLHYLSIVFENTNCTICQSSLVNTKCNILHSSLWIQLLLFFNRLWEYKMNYLS
jgi:hypothetical protein